jgi:hypothetical protein
MEMTRAFSECQAALGRLDLRQLVTYPGQPVLGLPVV